MRYHLLRDVAVDHSAVYRWVQKVGPELNKRSEKHLRRANGQMVDFRLTARRDAKAAKAKSRSS